MIEKYQDGGASRGDLRRARKSLGWSKLQMRNFQVYGDPNYTEQASRQDVRDHRRGLGPSVSKSAYRGNVIGLMTNYRNLMANNIMNSHISTMPKNMSPTEELGDELEVTNKYAYKDRYDYNDIYKDSDGNAFTNDQNFFKSLAYIDLINKNNYDDTYADSFAQAFDMARNKGFASFIWNGKRYGTMNKGENVKAWLDVLNSINKEEYNRAILMYKDEFDNDWDGNFNSPISTKEQNNLDNRYKNSDTAPTRINGVNEYLHGGLRIYDEEGFLYYNYGDDETDRSNWGWKKFGGKLTKFQQGGQMKQLQLQLIQLVQAAMQGNPEATKLINSIMNAAKQGDQQAVQIAQAIQQIVQQMQGGTPSAKQGTKLNYLRTLKNQCNDDEELQFFKVGGKVGGKVCSKCIAKKKAMKAQKGAEVKSTGITTAMQGIKVELAKCGKKIQSKLPGGNFKAGTKKSNGNTTVVNSETRLTYEVPFTKGTRNDSINTAYNTPDLKGNFPSKKQAVQMVNAANAARATKKPIKK